MEPVKPCSSNPCSNGGTCINTVDGLFVCNCANGFSGTTCSQTVTNYCTSKTCVHGTTFSDTLKQTCICKCENGFHGDSCEIETFKCSTLGTFPDPKYCWIYYICSQGDTSIEKNTFSCPLKIIGTTELQLVFKYDPETKTGTCTFPSSFEPYEGQNCSFN